MRKLNLPDTFFPRPAAYDQRIYGEPEDHVAINDPDTPVMTEDAPAGAVVREGDYGTRVTAIEPGGAEFIPLHERHGSPLQLFWTWVSPNMEFATIFVGVLGVAAFGMSFWQSFLAIVIGTALGGISQGLLSQQGPLFGVPQMVLSRLGFGYWGNVLPAGLNSITAGIGWFAVNSVSATFALNTLTHLAKPACLVIVVLIQIAVAFFGHNLVHVFERYAFPVLVVIFAIAAVVVLSKAHPGAPHKTIPGAFLIEVGATFGYAVGWNPYASDYTRYMKPSVSKEAVAWWAFLGLFLSCVLLEVVGAAAATVVSPGAALGNDPTGAFTGLMATPLADATLLAICLGGISANALNIYSGAMSFVTLGIRLPLALRRALVAVVFGIIGFIVALTGLHDAATKYNNFLLVIAYWIAPWLAVMFCDRLRRARQTPAELEPRWPCWPGWSCRSSSSPTRPSTSASCPSTWGRPVT